MGGRVYIGAWRPGGLSRSPTTEGSRGGVDWSRMVSCSPLPHHPSPLTPHPSPQVLLASCLLCLALLAPGLARPEAASEAEAEAEARYPAYRGFYRTGEDRQGG